VSSGCNESRFSDSQAVSIPQGELYEFSQYLILVSTVFRRFSMVPMHTKRIFILFLSSVYRWFADKIGLCVALALYLWERRNFIGYLSIYYSWLVYVSVCLICAGGV
jgi:hypothetical protein